MEQIIVLIAGVPILSALLTHLLGPRMGRRVAHLSMIGTVLTFGISVAALWLVLAGHGPKTVSLFGSGALLLLEPLSTLMAVVIAGISLVVHVYSLRYMAEEIGYSRFFVLLDLMTATLLVMVFAGDLLTLLIAWQLVGVLLYFLLGQNTRDVSAYRYAFWTKITYRIGDLPLLIAAVLLYQAYGTGSLPAIFEQISTDPGAHQVLGWPLMDVVAALIALAAFARSAQFLLHTWLPYSMSGPTPVSALMHAGIVNAGGFLINRFAPVFVHSSGVLHWVFIVGLFTAVIGSILMLTQNDIKKSLGYSTMGQMGFMIMECGIGAFSLAIYHLIAHGLFKGTLFLGAGSIINAARKDDGVPKDDLYTFVVERRPVRQRLPWRLMAAITLAVPIAILVAAHWLVAEDYFQKQSAIVLLFFGWITGAQLIFTTYRMRTRNLRRLITLSIFSFAVVVLGYTLISHAFDLFLYPDPVFREQIYAAADFDLFWFDLLMGLIALVIIFGWIIISFTDQNGNHKSQYRRQLWLSVYALISREFYLTDLYTRFSRALLAFAGRLNLWLRWI
ncbi:NADH-quinone oxidoreductase subunit L [Thiohalophilus sp.]|uniref:NADH-quinone oxidoreductase subunit 5 family protein n=1 Tax=Thiohalophilus sp. TaxID=3028392 RepID=UPI002ACD8AEB|nr:proton-conducting transporter membrane subunit [Thiohalophilus sp.]MDZ7662287.1 proton-conducting transporter membrane subunit [Thiohalophilus sp.]